MSTHQQLQEGAEVVSGVWKFGENITPEQLVELAKKWAKADVSKRYIDLHVRKCSKTQHGIGFKYVLHNGKADLNSEDYKRFFYRISDQLRRDFGNDFVGWDVSSFTYIII